MAAEWLAAVKGITAVSEKVFGGPNKYSKLRAEERTKLADLLDEIADEVLSMKSK